MSWDTLRSSAHLHARPAGLGNEPAGGSPLDPSWRPHPATRGRPRACTRPRSPSAGGDRREADRSAPPDPTPFLAWSVEHDWLLERPWLWILAIVSPVTLIVLPAFWLALSAASRSGSSRSSSMSSSSSSRQAHQRCRRPRHAAQRCHCGYATIFAAIGGSQPQAPLLRHTSRDWTRWRQCALRRFARIASFVMPRASIIWSPVQMALLWDVHAFTLSSAGDSEHVSMRAPGSLRLVNGKPWPRFRYSPTTILTGPFPLSTQPRHRGARSRPSPDRHFGRSCQRCHGRPGGHLPLRHRLQHVRQEHAAPRCRSECRAGHGRRPGRGYRLAMPPLDRLDLHAGRGLARAWCLVLHGRVAAAQGGGRCRAATGDHDRPVLYLLDEILQGTNTAERQIASRR